MRQQRILVVFVLLMLGFSAVLARLVRLTVAEADMWKRESHLSTLRVQALPFERGWITDRHGVPLATTERVRDLVFLPRDWRRGAVVGQLAHAAWSLGEPLPAAPQVAEEVSERLAALGARPLRSLAALEPRQRRRDLAYYLSALFGEAFWQGAEARLRDELLSPTLRLDELPGWASGLESALARARDEEEALLDLAAAGGSTAPALLAALDAALLRAHQRVDRVRAASREDARGGDDTADASLASDVEGLPPLRRGLLGAVALTHRLSGPPPARTAGSGGEAPRPRLLLDGLGADPREAYRRLQQLHVEFDSEPVTLASRVPYDVQTLVAIRRRWLAGLRVETSERRVYPPEVAEVAPLVVGRVGPPRAEDVETAARHRLRLANLSSLTDLTAEELDAFETLRVLVREVDYAYGEERGVLGVESALEEVLRGKRGWVASSSRGDGTDVERVEPQRGLNVTLTLDVDLQRACQDVLDAIWDQPPLPEGAAHDVARQWGGAIVLLDAVTGEVRALASGPRPTREELTRDLAQLYTADPERRLLHRAVRPGRTLNLPPPGSTFKPVSALAGLVGGVVNASSTFVCEQRLRVGTQERDVMGCLGRHGPIGLVQAVSKSCNVYFYHLGAQTGGEALREMAARFGFGRSAPLLSGNAALGRMGVRVGDGFPESAPRLEPGPDSRTAAMRLAIGQAPLDDVTPLQVATMMAALGTGSLPAPVLVASIESLGPVPFERPRSLGVPEGHLAVVRRALEGVVDGGTGLPIWTAQPALAAHVAGKTGTAQVGGQRDHAWFAGYMPRAAPRLAFAVLVEDVGLHGSEAALPVFLQVLEKPAVRAFLAREVLPPGVLRESDP